MGLMASDWLVDAIVWISLVTAGACAYFYSTRNFNYWKSRGVKDVKPILLFGNVAPCLFIKKTPQKLLLDIYRRGEGEKMIGFYAFDRPYLILRDPELIKDVFVKDFNNFPDKIMTGNEKDAFGASNVFLATNPTWKHIRPKLTHIFTSGKIKNMFELMLKICPDFEDYLNKLNIDDKVGKPVEIKEICAKLMTDFIGTTAFGLKLNSLKDPEAEFRKYGKEMFQSSYKRYFDFMSILLFPTLRKLPFVNSKFFDEGGTDFLRKSFWSVIDERISSNIKRPDLIDLLIEIKKEQEKEGFNGYKLEGDALVSQAAIFFSGGFETSSSVTTFALYELAKNQEIQNKLRDELLQGLKENNGKVTYEMVNSLPYLDMVLHETLRMYPTLNYLDRTSESDYTFSNSSVTINKGVPVILPMEALHFDPKYFPNPHTFDPERFSDVNRSKITPFTYFPFGEGPRKCIGLRLGKIQVKLGLICFLAKYELSFCKETLNPLKMDNLWIVNRSKGGLILNLRKISM